MGYSRKTSVQHAETDGLKAIDAAFERVVRRAKDKLKDEFAEEFRTALQEGRLLEIKPDTGKIALCLAKTVIGMIPPDEAKKLLGSKKT